MKSCECRNYNRWRYWLLDGFPGETYNISADYDGMTLGQYAEYIASLGDRKVVYDIEDNLNASQAINSLLDNNKIKKIGFLPIYSICGGIKRTYNILKKIEFLLLLLIDE